MFVHDFGLGARLTVRHYRKARPPRVIAAD
jgi:hypothetical protein